MVIGDEVFDFQYRTLALAGSARDIHVALPGEMNLAVLREANY